MDDSRLLNLTAMQPRRAPQNVTQATMSQGHAKGKVCSG